MPSKTKSRNIYYNPNPKKNKTNDCVIRSICKAMEIDWDTIFNDLVAIAFEFKRLPNDDEVWKEYLTRHGFTYHGIKVTKGDKRPTVDSFARSHKTGTFVLRVANHVVTCHNGYFYDTWDSGQRSMYGYWEKPTTTSELEEN